MSESAKKRKSLWDAEEETPNSPDYQEWRGPKSDNAWKPKNDPGWSYGDNVTETKEPRQNYHYKNMSPAFDRWGRQGTSHSPDNGRTQSRRYPGRGRSRSRSRSRSQSRGKGEIRSRSRSRGRGEGRSWSKGKGESRSRSRSRGRDRVKGRNRSRSQDRGSTRGQNRSRSPPHNYKRDPYASGDRRSGPRMPSQVCRDFTAGKCRRGSDCRFFHSDVVNHRDIDHSEDNLAEKLGSRSEHGHSSRYAGTEGHGYQSRDKLPDMYHMEDELPRNQSRGTVICRDFVKGSCRWAASCKFSHDGSSSDNYGKGTRNATFNHGQDNQASGTGKSVCKYFAAGKCYKDNCKFSHDGPTPSNLEVSPLYDIGGNKFDDKNNWLNGPTWEDAERASDHVKTTGWDETVARKDSAVTVLADKTNDRLGHSFGNESRAWGSTETKFTNSDQERGVSPHKGTAGNFAALNASEPSVMQKFSHAQEVHPASQASLSQYMERTSAPVLGHNLNQEASGIILSATSTQPYGSSSYYVQPQGLTEDSIARTLGSDAPNDFLNSRDGLHQVHLPGQSFSGTGIDMSSEHFAVFNGTGQEANMFLPNPSDGHNQKEAPNLPEMLELKVPSTLSNTVTSEQVDQMKTSPTPVMNNFEKELPEAQLQRVFNPSDPTVMVPSLQRVFNPSDPTVMVPSHPISSVHATYGQANPEMRVLDQYHPPGGIGLGQVTSGNNTFPPDNSSYLDRETNKVPMQQMIQYSTDDPEPEKINQIDRMEQQEKKLFEETNGNNKLAAIESNNGKEKDHPGAVDVHGQVEEESGNKDEKVMRLFKNALIEFVKEILKPTWKEGRMSREVHKTIVKKVVDKVTGTIQGDHVPKTQEKIELYLSSSRAKLTKLVQAYVERLLKNDA